MIIIKWPEQMLILYKEGSQLDSLSQMVNDKINFLSSNILLIAYIYIQIFYKPILSLVQNNSDSGLNLAISAGD